MRNWNLEGMRVTGLYMGTMRIAGRVDVSRVKYGGGVSHHIVLDNPIVVYGTKRERLILEHRDVDQVLSG